MGKITWKDLNIKEKLAITSACIGFIAGWTLTGIAAFVPLLLSEQGVLWILAQSLTYASAVFGVSMYFNAESRQMKRDLKHYFSEHERLQTERMNIRQGIDAGEIPLKDEDDDV